MTANDPKPVRLSLLALPETTPGALFGLLEVFAAVGVSWSALTGEDAPARRIEARLVARTREPFPCPLGTPITPHASLAEVTVTDVLVVTDLALGPGDRTRGRWPEEAAWARAQFERGALVCSVCTGSVFLAEARLLQGVEATTHWAMRRMFATQYPDVRLRPERILCAAGPDQRIVTGGGAASWADLALYLVSRFSGRAEAVRIAKIFLLGDHGDGQLPFASMGQPRPHDDAVIAECEAWIAGQYREPNPVTRMVALSGLPERTFKRRFRAATGLAPIDYVQMLRIEQARQLLESSAENTDAVGHRVGYEDPAYFRRLFKRLTGVTPARYRQRYSGIREIPAAAER
jgi:transcriptional regulator GlxA family with amidase domain